jgi:hypothetical protein
VKRTDAPPHSSRPLPVGLFILSLRLWAALLFAVVLFSACKPRPETPATAQVDPHLQTNGTIEVTAKLIEIPEGAIFQRELYDYATVLKYQVLRVHRGTVKTNTLFVAQYNPFKPRNEAADARAPGIGGTLKEFRPGQVQHLALEVPIEDYFMGGIVNKYFGQTTDPIYWAVWTDLEKR